MYAMSMAVDWSELMYRMMDSGDDYHVPGYKKSVYLGMGFFATYIFLVSFFIINLFVGVIISAFNR